MILVQASLPQINSIWNTEHKQHYIKIGCLGRLFARKIENLILNPVTGELFHSNAYHNFHEDLSSCSCGLEEDFGNFEVGMLSYSLLDSGNEVQDTFSWFFLAIKYIKMNEKLVSNELVVRHQWGSGTLKFVEVIIWLRVQFGNNCMNP